MRGLRKIDYERPATASLPLRYLSPNPTRFPAQVEHGYDSCLLLCLKVINAEGEPAGQHPETSMLLPMNPMKTLQAFDVGDQRSDTVIAHPSFPCIVKLSRFLQILSRFRQDDHPPHDAGFCRRSFNSAIPRNSPSPRSILANRVAMTSPCQSGDGTASGVWTSEAHSNSMACSRSSTLIRSMSAA